MPQAKITGGGEGKRTRGRKHVEEAVPAAFSNLRLPPKNSMRELTFILNAITFITGITLLHFLLYVWLPISNWQFCFVCLFLRCRSNFQIYMTNSINKAHTLV
ncbi:UNVERIFIED_CONTAM: hypothetical protein K2H54_054570 [Gekko kuhli]